MSGSAAWADDLLTPTITDAPAASAPPWRVDSLVYPAFFGGAMAVAVLGAINSGRLGVGTRKTALILACGAAALVAELAAIGLLSPLVSGVQRVVLAGAGVAVWGVVRAVQLRPYRAAMLRGVEPQAFGARASQRWSPWASPRTSWLTSSRRR